MRWWNSLFLRLRLPYLIIPGKVPMLKLYSHTPSEALTLPERNIHFHQTDCGIPSSFHLMRWLHSCKTWHRTMFKFILERKRRVKERDRHEEESERENGVRTQGWERLWSTNSLIHLKMYYCQSRKSRTSFKASKHYILETLCWWIYYLINLINLI